MRMHPYFYIKISRRASRHRFAQPRIFNCLGIAYARGYVYFNCRPLFSRTHAPADLPRFLGHFAFSSADRTLRQRIERAEKRTASLAHGPGTLACCAFFYCAVRLRPFSQAVLTKHGPVYNNASFNSENGFFKTGFQIDGNVASAPSPALSPASAKTAEASEKIFSAKCGSASGGKNIFKNISQIKSVKIPARGWSALGGKSALSRKCPAELIVLAPFFIVAQNLISLVYLLEFFFIPAFFVRVVLVRQFPIRTFNILLRRIFRYS